MLLGGSDGPRVITLRLHLGQALHRDLLSRAPQLLIPHHGRDRGPIHLPPVHRQANLPLDLRTHPRPDHILHEICHLISPFQLVRVRGNGLTMGTQERLHHDHGLLVHGGIDCMRPLIAGTLPGESISTDCGRVLLSILVLACPHTEARIIGPLAALIVPGGIRGALGQLRNQLLQMIVKLRLSPGVQGPQPFNCSVRGARC